MKFKKITSANGFTNVLTGRSSSAIVAVNDAGEFGFLPEANIPYIPIGGKGTLKIVEDVLIFKPYKF